MSYLVKKTGQTGITRSAIGKTMLRGIKEINLVQKCHDMKFNHTLHYSRCYWGGMYRSIIINNMSGARFMPRPDNRMFPLLGIGTTIHGRDKYVAEKKWNVISTKFG